MLGVFAHDHPQRLPVILVPHATVTRRMGSDEFQHRIVFVGGKVRAGRFWRANHGVGSRSFLR